MSGLKAETVIRSIGLPNSHRVEAMGFSRGIWILWKSIIDVEVVLNSVQFIKLKVKFSRLQEWVMFIGVYGSPRWETRKELWPELGAIAQDATLPWLLTGDFNALLHDDEKQGGLRSGRHSCQLFQNFFNNYCMKDIEFKGQNLHGIEDLFSSVLIVLSVIYHGKCWLQVRQCIIIKSDHRPLVICFGLDPSSKPPCLFRFLSG